MSGKFEELIDYDTRTNQPAAGQEGRLYFVTDEGVLERDNGVTWDQLLILADFIDYVPADLDKWDCFADPGDAADALDQLAARVYALENP